MKEDFEGLLDARLEQLRNHEEAAEPPAQPVDEPDSLAELIRVAEDIRGLPRPSLSPRAARRVENQLIQRTRELNANSAAPQQTTKGLRVLPVVLVNRNWQVRRVLGLAATILLALAVMGGGSVMAAADSLPASPLYKVKIAGEQAQLMMAQSSAGRARARMLMAEHRLAEIESIVASGNRVDTALIEALQREIDGALSEMENVPPRNALGLLSQLSGIIGRQKAMLQAVLITVPQTAESNLDRSVAAANKGQSIAAEALARSLREQSAPASPSPTPSPSPTATSTPASSPTARILPTSTPVPPDRVEKPESVHTENLDLKGPIQAIGAAAWTINGQTVIVDGRTKIGGAAPQIGAQAEVKLVQLPDGSLLAVEIEVEARAQPTLPPSRAPESTRIPSPTSTREPEATRSPSPTTTREPEPTESPSPTATREQDKGEERQPERHTESKQMPTPTATPTPVSTTPVKTSTPHSEATKVSTPTPTTVAENQETESIGERERKTQSSDSLKGSR